MAENSAAPEGRVADAPPGNWVDKWAPAASRPYLRLSRADRPIGTWLLLLPCWWGLLLAMVHTGTARWEDAWIALGCAIGAFLMRGAGCTWNDITDRDIDAQVARTRSRPIPSGQVSPKAALVWLVVQALLAFGILLTFNLPAIALGVASLVLCLYLSLRQAVHMVAAGVSGACLQLGRASGMDGAYRDARPAGAVSLRRRDRVDAVL